MSSNSKIAIFKKGDLYGAMALAKSAESDGAVVGNYRQKAFPAMFHKQYSDNQIAESEFNKAIITSVERGWTIGYIGTPRLRVIAYFSNFGLLVTNNN